jgi:hypothetical protein
LVFFGTDIDGINLGGRARGTRRLYSPPAGGDSPQPLKRAGSPGPQETSE